MRRYVVDCPKLWPGTWYADSKSKTITIVESDGAPQFTGLYDSAGNKLMAVSDGDPIGFVRFGR